MMRRLAWLTLGTFAIGTDAFMFAGILPYLSRDLAVSISSVALLVSIYAAIYAIGAPILATLTGTLNRKTILVSSMLTFVVTSVIAASVHGYWSLFGARCLGAVASALFTPAAYALAGTAVDRSVQGRALALVAGGFSASIAIGAPISTLIAGSLNWRVAFVVVGALALLATVGMAYGLQKPAQQPAINLRTRLAPARDPAILLALLQYVLWLAGSFAVYFFLAPLLGAIVHADIAQADGHVISTALFIFGVTGIIGTIAGGYVVDAWGPKRTLVPGLLIIAAVPVFFSVLTRVQHAETTLVPALIAVGIWGSALWALNSVQQVRLLKLAPTAANMVLSLNASANYVGMAFGSALGAATVKMTSIGNLGWIGAGCVVAAILLLGLTVGHRRATA